MGAGCRDVEISHSRLTDLGGGGVKVGHDSQRTTVQDNEIAHAGRLFLSAVGIWVGHSAENIIIHNHIQDLHYSGISVGWQWNFGPSNAVSNIVQRTLIAAAGNRFKLDRRLEERYNLEGEPQIATNFALPQGTRVADVVIENLTVDGNKAFAPHRNRFERNRIVDSGGAKGVAIDINGETESVVIVHNELRETRGPQSRIGILIGAETRDIRCEDNQIEGFAIPIKDLHQGEE